MQWKRPWVAPGTDPPMISQLSGPGSNDLGAGFARTLCAGELEWKQERRIGPWAGVPSDTPAPVLGF